MRVEPKSKKTRKRVAPKRAGVNASARPKRPSAKKAPKLKLVSTGVKNARVNRTTERGSVSFKVVGEGKVKTGPKKGAFLIGGRSYQAAHRPHGLTWSQAHRLKASEEVNRGLNTGFGKALELLSAA